MVSVDLKLVDSASRPSYEDGSAAIGRRDDANHGMVSNGCVACCRQLRRGNQVVVSESRHVGDAFRCLSRVLPFQLTAT